MLRSDMTHARANRTSHTLEIRSPSLVDVLARLNWRLLVAFAVNCVGWWAVAKLLIVLWAAGQ